MTNNPASIYPVADPERKKFSGPRVNGLRRFYGAIGLATAIIAVSALLLSIAFFSALVQLVLSKADAAGRFGALSFN